MILEFLNRIAKDIKKSPLRKYFNQLYYDPSTAIIRLKDIDYVVVDGCKYYPSDQLGSVVRPEGKWFEGVKGDDVVVDIGADIGAVTIPLAKKARRVIALEPLFADELKRNVDLNGLENVEVLVSALGPKDLGISEAPTFEYSSKKQRSTVHSFQTLKEMVGGQIDFIKVDCEGCEWCIEPEEFGGVREIRIEFHVRRWHKKEDYRKIDKWVGWLNKEGYEVDVKYGVHSEPTILFADTVYLRASRGKE